MPGQSAVDVLFVLAHQDDEVGILATALREHRAGARCWFAYLTDGGKSVSPALRDQESVQALARIGMDGSRLGFLGDEDGRIGDGQLVESLERSERLLLAWLAGNGVTPQRCYAIDWEGGHVDHDASHLVAQAVAARFRAPLFAFSLYNGFGRPRRFFRLLDFVPATPPIERRPIGWGDALRQSLSVFRYPSQRRTWLVLGPGFALKTLVRREERVRQAELARIGRRPHGGPLLYETLFRYPYAAFAAHSRGYRERLLGIQLDNTS